jgi:putative tryptophan/tyrosine transport system substrate-binding protein
VGAQAVERVARFFLPELASGGDFDLGSRLRPSRSRRAPVAEAGCLVSDGFRLRATWRQVAEMAARVLRGRHPRRIPTGLRARFEPVLNAATAPAVGVEIPPPVLARADGAIG